MKWPGPSRPRPAPRSRRRRTPRPIEPCWRPIPRWTRPSSGKTRWSSASSAAARSSPCPSSSLQNQQRSSGRPSGGPHPLLLLLAPPPIAGQLRRHRRFRYTIRLRDPDPIAQLPSFDFSAAIASIFSLSWLRTGTKKKTSPSLSLNFLLFNQTKKYQTLFSFAFSCVAFVFAGVSLSPPSLYLSLPFKITTEKPGNLYRLCCLVRWYRPDMLGILRGAKGWGFQKFSCSIWIATADLLIFSQLFFKYVFYCG